jgi:hypothetical protein
MQPDRHLLLLLLAALACAPKADSPATTSDSAFAEVQRRGALVMGVDQDASEHVFEDLADGGRIVFQMKDSADTAGARIIRAHLDSIARSFAAGVFTDPAAVHATEVPGTRVMAERRALITYESAPRERGAELRIRTSDSTAIAAIHDFLAFQRSDHRAAGHEGMDHDAH